MLPSLLVFPILISPITKGVREREGENWLLLSAGPTWPGRQWPPSWIHCTVYSTSPLGATPPDSSPHTHTIIQEICYPPFPTLPFPIPKILGYAIQLSEIHPLYPGNIIFFLIESPHFFIYFRLFRLV